MKKLVFTLITIAILTSCAGSKQVSRNNRITTDTEKVEVINDSSFVQKKFEKETAIVTAPIEKENTISLQTTDELVNQKINKALRNFKYIEKSGKNTITAQYDEATMQLIFKAFVAGKESVTKETTSDIIINTDKQQVTEKTFEEKTDEYMYKKIRVIPWWVWVAFYFLFLDSKVTKALSLFIPKLTGATSILSLLFKRK